MGGKIQRNNQTGVVVFDMNAVDAKKLTQFTNGIVNEESNFRILKELDLDRGRIFGSLEKRGSGKGIRRGYRNESDNGWGYRDKRGRNDRPRRDYNRRYRQSDNHSSRSTYRNKYDTKSRHYGDDSW